MHKKRAKIALYRSPEYQINLPFGSGEEVQNRFPKQRPCQPAWISDRNDFTAFYLNQPDASYQVWLICLSVQDKKRKINFQDGSHGNHRGFPIRMILAILIYPHSNASYQVSRQSLFGFKRSEK